MSVYCRATYLKEALRGMTTLRNSQVQKERIHSIKGENIVKGGGESRVRKGE